MGSRLPTVAPSVQILTGAGPDNRSRVNTGSTSVSAAPILRRGWRHAGPRPYILVVILWFLYLFAPQKLIQFYIPAARPITWLPELLLWICAIQWLRSPGRKPGYPAFTRFMLVMIFGIGVAFVIGNWGLARGTVRILYQYYLLGLMTLTFCNTAQRARPVLTLYFGYFVWFGLWGLISLRTSPLTADVDPGARVIVYWQQDFDNRDAFGPLMVAGLAYSIYYAQAARALRTPARKAWGVVSIALCSLGFVTSFGRGAFLGFLATATSILLRSRRRLVILLTASAIIAVIYLIAPALSDRYLASMQTITNQGTEGGTGRDRAYLWDIAWREFLSSPVVGVGTDNYGIANRRVVSDDELAAHGYTRGAIWGRRAHSAPMTILAEYGLVGAMMALLIIVDFFRTNRRIRLHAASTSRLEEGSDERFPPGYVNAIALGLHSVFLALCVSSIFYELLYTQLLWTVLTLNRMLYLASGAARANENSRSASGPTT